MSFGLRVSEGLLLLLLMLLFLKHPPELLSEPSNIWKDNVVVFWAIPLRLLWVLWKL